METILAFDGVNDLKWSRQGKPIESVRLIILCKHSEGVTPVDDLPSFTVRTKEPCVLLHFSARLQVVPRY